MPPVKRAWCDAGTKPSAEPPCCGAPVPGAMQRRVANRNNAAGVLPCSGRLETPDDGVAGGRDCVRRLTGNCRLPGAGANRANMPRRRPVFR